MKLEKLHIIGKHRYSFRKGEKALVVEVKMLYPDNLPPRPCFVSIFDDGKIDYVPVSEVSNGNYKLI